MGLSVWRETSKKLTVYRVCYTPIETLKYALLTKLVRSRWPIFSHFDQTRLVNKGFIMWTKDYIKIARTKRAIPSGQDRPILPARVANQNIEFASVLSAHEARHIIIGLPVLYSWSIVFFSNHRFPLELVQILYGIISDQNPSNS